MFADDTKIFKRIQSTTDFMQFQEDINHRLYRLHNWNLYNLCINHLVAWSIKWQLKFNDSKSYILHLGPSHSYGDYYLNGIKITTSTTVRDLGITIDSCLKFHDHTSFTVTI